MKIPRNSHQQVRPTMRNDHLCLRVNLNNFFSAPLREQTTALPEASLFPLRRPTNDGDDDRTVRVISSQKRLTIMITIWHSVCTHHDNAVCGGGNHLFDQVALVMEKRCSRFYSVEKWSRMMRILSELDTANWVFVIRFFISGGWIDNNCSVDWLISPVDWSFSIDEIYINVWKVRTNSTSQKSVVSKSRHRCNLHELSCSIPGYGDYRSHK